MNRKTENTNDPLLFFEKVCYTVSKEILSISGYAGGKGAKPL
jgi:hypothetical protein